MVAWIKKLSLFLAAIIFLELVLQLAAYFSPKFNYLLLREQPRWIADAKLGFRPHPSYPEHDANGFRNAKVPSRSCLVALGDSQTYGWKVQAFQAWPQQVGSMGRVTIYNMAVPQYGPVHSLLLWPEAERFSPRFVIEGFYTGNDLFDCYEMVYNRGLETDLKSSTTSVLQAVKAAGTNFRFLQTPALLNDKPAQINSLKDFVAEHSKLYGLFRATKRIYHYKYSHTNKDIYFIDDWETVKKLARSDSDFWIFDSPDARTLLLLNSRSAALDLSDPRIAEGMRIAFEVFRKMDKMAHVENIQFIVLLIPTKELVFKDVVYAHSSQIPAGFRALVENEERVLADTKIFLTGNRISFIDALPVLRKALQEGNQPYSVSANSHMNAKGHQIVAKEILRQLGKYFGSSLQGCIGKG